MTVERGYSNADLKQVSEYAESKIVTSFIMEDGE